MGPFMFSRYIRGVCIGAVILLFVRVPSAALGSTPSSNFLVCTVFFATPEKGVLKQLKPPIYALIPEFAGGPIFRSYYLQTDSTMKKSDLFVNDPSATPNSKPWIIFNTLPDSQEFPHFYVISKGVYAQESSTGQSTSTASMFINRLTGWFDLATSVQSSDNSTLTSSEIGVCGSDVDKF